ncbi:MAG: phage tail tape measure protein [Clostridia bacterium]|nr:phage tail tape measure protein [Clostridia bacterium]
MATISSTVSLVDNISSKLTTIKGNLDEVVSAFESMQGSFDTSQSKANGFSWDTFIKNCETAGQKIADVGTKMTLALTTPLVLLGKSMYGAATDYESAFAGVRKTTEATEEEYQALYDGMLQLSETETSVGFVDLAGIMEMAGQLGVAEEELLGFTKTYADLQESTNIQGGEGAADLQRFLNLTEQSTQNVARVGGVIVELGNNFATTESEILAMATRMASTGDLAGFTSTEILALSAALSSAGINAEAGGSAAGKLMKSMQLAAEMGAEAYNLLGGTYGNAVDFSYFISSKENLLGVAQELGVTTDYVEQLGQSWLDMEKFAQVSGKTADQFRTDWADNPAQGMLDFFVGLGNLDASGQQSALSMLNEMGITEIRLSNLVAAMAGNSDLYSQALQMAYDAYMQDVDVNALAVEAGKRYSTQESQNAMLGNKLQNTMADFGDNLVTALQPALDCVNGLLESFNSLSETDQTKLVETLGAIAVLGPSMSILGNGIKAIGDIGTFIGKLPGWGSQLVNFFSGPAGWVALGTAAVAGLVTLIQSIPTEIEKIYEKSQNIPITFSQENVDTMLSQIAEIQGKLDLLHGNEFTEEAKATSEAVKMGWGTQDMFTMGLAYESALGEANIQQISANYAAQITELKQKILHSQDGAQNAIWFEEIKGLEVARDIDISAAQQSYSTAISDLFNGMAAQYPEAAKVLEDAAGQYDMLSLLQYDMWNMPVPENWGQMTENEQTAHENAWYAERDAISNEILRLASDLGYLGMSYEEALDKYRTFGSREDIFGDLYKQVEKDLIASQETISQNPILADWLQAMVSDPSVVENLDFTALTGAFDGIIKTLDFVSALQEAGDEGKAHEFGEYLTQGLADGITANSGTAETGASTVATNVLAALASTLGVNSPSVFGIEYGMYVDLGLAQGITENVGAVTAAVQATGAATIAAMMAVCNQVVAAGNSIVNYGAGYSMGANIGRGMAAGIRSQIGAVQAAARALASAAASAASTRLAIHSPSRVFYGFGEMSGLGYINALYDMTGQVERAAGRLFDIEYQAVNKAAWNEIQLFGGYEIEDLMNVNNEDYEAKVSDADMKKIRELAEREVINQFTTAELHIEFTANNKIESDLDLDGVVSYLEDQVAERLEMVAEGVYE